MEPFLKFGGLGLPHGDSMEPFLKFGGLDTGLINFCRQISCFQAGNDVGNPSDLPLVRSLTRHGDQGGIIASLANTITNPLPSNLPFVVGIGLTVGNSRYDDGDGLITFNGQRFSPTSAEEPIGFLVVQKPLLNCDQRYGFRVKEVVLGAFDLAGNPDGSARPDTAVLNKALGYAHINSTYFAIYRVIPLENQEPFVVCTALDSCEHAAINLFKSTIGNERYCESPAFVPTEPALTLSGSRVTLTVDYPALGTHITIPNEQTIGEGIEFLTGSLQLVSFRTVVGSKVDVGATFIDVQYTETTQSAFGAFNGLVFDFDPFSPTIVGVSLDPLSTFSAAQVVLGFSINRVTINIPGLSFTPSSRIKVNLTLAPVSSP